MASSRTAGHLILNAMEETPSHFFKVILPETLSDKKLRIPDMFVRKFGEELPAFATLTAPNGRVWRVGLTKDGRKTWFDEGFHDFIKYHSITAGYFLVFKYVKNSNFHILVFDLSACEINYPHNHEEPGNYEHNPIHQDETESEDSAGLVHTKTKKPTSSSLEKKYSEKGQGKGPISNMNTDLLQQNPIKPYINSARGSNCASSSESLKFVNGCGMQNNRCKLEQQQEENQSNAADVSRRGKLNSNEMNDSQESLHRKRNLDGNSKNTCSRSPLVHCNDLKMDRTKYKATADDEEEDQHLQEVIVDEKKVAYKVVSALDHHKDLKIDRTKYRATEDEEEEDEPFTDVVGNKKKAAYENVSDSSGKVNKRTKVDELELMAALEDAGISFAGRFRSLAAEERERALNVARLLKPKNPSFMVILRSYRTYSTRNHLRVPAKFANKYLSGEVHVKLIKLQGSDGREWPAQIIRKHNGVSLTKGWAEFSGDKNMEEGDICVFELVRMEDILLKVSVFHETIE